MKKYKIIIIILGVLLALIFAVGFYYNYQISRMTSKSEEVVVTIPGGSITSIGETLKQNKLIRSVFIFKLYTKLNRKNNLKAATYKFNRNMNMKTLVDNLEKGSTYNPDQITVTFQEGLNIRRIAKVVEENTNNTYDDFMNLMNDKEYIKSLISEYWFLTDDILNEKIYYPLEGYLFPETYFLKNKDVTSKEIIKTMLDEMNNKLEPFRKDIEASEFTIHELMTLASIVEMEGKTSNDRASIAGVMVNRVKGKWSLGMDTTTYYYLKRDDYKAGLTSYELNTCDYAYNTRCSNFIGLPVGPITNAGMESLKSTIRYHKHDYYYFVSDCSGKNYFTKTSTEHYNTIEKLKREGKWSCYQ